MKMAAFLAVVLMAMPPLEAYALVAPAMRGSAESASTAQMLVGRLHSLVQLADSTGKELPVPEPRHPEAGVHGGFVFDFFVHVRETFAMNPLMITITVALNVFVIGFALLYRSCATSPAYFVGDWQLPTEDWPFEHWKLKSDWPICLMACCCPAIRWADTIGSDRLWGGFFWHAFLLFLVLQILGIYTYGFSVLVLLCIGIYFRQKIRGNFKKSNSWSTYASDVLLWCCCPCLAIAQEALEVERRTRDAATDKMILESHAMNSS